MLRMMKMLILLDEPIFHYHKTRSSHEDELKRKDGVIIQKFSAEKVCGIKVLNVSKNLVGKWQILMKDDKGQEHQDSFTLIVKP